MTCRVKYFVMQSIRADSFIYRLGHLVFPDHVSPSPFTYSHAPNSSKPTGAANPQLFSQGGQTRGKIALSFTLETGLDLYYTAA